MKIFEQLKDDSYWKEINADKSFNCLQTELMEHVNEAIDNVLGDQLDKLW